MKKFFSKNRILFLLFLLIIPTFYTLLKPGIFSMGDPHLFRLYEYDKCIHDLTFPCRWAPDSAFLYGEPMFNFYGQLPYIFGELFHLIGGLSLIDSLKALFISSLVFSAFGMFLLAKQLWQNSWAALISALVYIYAPYRSVDIYVRGALPEALSFVFYPFILYFFHDFIKSRKLSSLLAFSAFLAGLVINHNLSALMFAFFFIPWALYYLSKEKAWRLTPKFIFAGLGSLGLSAFYLLPVVFEEHLVTINKTIEGYYDFHNHFVTLKQMLFSRYWGYGASLWGEDDRMSMAVGHMQWILPLAVLAFIALKSIKHRKVILSKLDFLVLFVLGWMVLILTHNKSTFLWEKLPFMAYIQFPWRFFGVAIFIFALSSGVIMTFGKKWLAQFTLAAVITAALLALNIPFFHEDLWFNITDQQQYSGTRFADQTATSLYDYWPIYGQDAPHQPAQEAAVVEGTDSAKLISKNSDQLTYSLTGINTGSKIQLAVAYFPGWKAFANGREVNIYPSGKLGLITADLPAGTKTLQLKFEDTPVRTVGDLISLASLVGFLGFAVRLKVKKV